MDVTLLRPADPRWDRALADMAHDVYQLPQYGKLCAAQEGGEARALLAADGAQQLLVPLILRPIPGEPLLDAVSPYGYGGPVATAAALTDAAFLGKALEACRETAAAARVVAAFLRLHPLLGPAPEALRALGTVVGHGETVSIDLRLPGEALRRQMRHGHRDDIARARREGFTAAMDDWSAYGDFLDLYEATMVRRAAADYYRFPRAYFDGLREALGPRLHLGVVRLGDEVAAAGLFPEVGGVVQYHLSGAHEAHERARPTKLLLDHVRDWARARGDTTFHLGGGVGSRADSLFEFKAGFSPLRHPFHTWRLVLDEEAYVRLCATADAPRQGAPEPSEGYFPAYRQPA